MYKLKLKEDKEEFLEYRLKFVRRHFGIFLAIQFVVFLFTIVIEFEHFFVQRFDRLLNYGLIVVVGFLIFLLSFRFKTSIVNLFPLISVLQVMLYMNSYFWNPVDEQVNYK